VGPKLGSLVTTLSEQRRHLITVYFTKYTLGGGSDRAIMEIIWRPRRFSPRLCDFCEQIAEQQVQVLQTNSRAVYYPSRGKKFSNTSLFTWAGQCKLCAYVLGLLEFASENTVDLHEAKTSATTTSAVCCYEDQ
jgi:hypothetical protein